MNKILSVGGQSKEFAIPEQYAGWQQDLMHIDHSKEPDILADAREFSAQPESSYDAVYCAHNLEHYYLHDAKKVLNGFKHLLKADGHAYIRVPDLQQVMQRVLNEKLGIADVLCRSPAGVIRVYDMFYGHLGKIELSAEEYPIHKMGYTLTSLRQILFDVGFRFVSVSVSSLNISAIAFLQTPTEQQCRLFGIEPRD